LEVSWNPLFSHDYRDYRPCLSRTVLGKFFFKYYFFVVSNKSLWLKPTLSFCATQVLLHTRSKSWKAIVLHRLTRVLLNFAVSGGVSDEVARSARNCLVHLTWTRFAELTRGGETAAASGDASEDAAAAALGKLEGQEAASASQSAAAQSAAAQSAGGPAKSGSFLTEWLLQTVLADFERTSRDVVNGFSSSSQDKSGAGEDNSCAALLSNHGVSAVTAANARCVRLLVLARDLLQCGGVHERDRLERCVGAGNSISRFAGSAHSRFSHMMYARSAVLLLPLGAMVRLVGSGPSCASGAGAGVLGPVLASPRLQKMVVGRAVLTCGDSDAVVASLELATALLESCGSLLCAAGEWISTVFFFVWNFVLFLAMRRWSPRKSR